MAYEKTVWSTGDIVTAEKLNKLEDGVANAGGSGSNLPTILNLYLTRASETDISATTNVRSDYTASELYTIIYDFVTGQNRACFDVYLHLVIDDGETTPYTYSRRLDNIKLNHSGYNKTVTLSCTTFTDPGGALNYYMFTTESITIESGILGVTDGTITYSRKTASVSRS